MNEDLNQEQTQGLPDSADQESSAVGKRSADCVSGVRGGGGAVEANGLGGPRPPTVWHELGQVFGRCCWQPVEDVDQIGERFHGVHLARGDEAEVCRRGASTTLAADHLPILATNGDAAMCALRCIVIHI